MAPRWGRGGTGGATGQEGRGDILRGWVLIEISTALRREWTWNESRAEGESPQFLVEDPDTRDVVPDTAGGLEPPGEVCYIHADC